MTQNFELQKLGVHEVEWLSHDLCPLYEFSENIELAGYFHLSGHLALKNGQNGLESSRDIKSPNQKNPANFGRSGNRI